MLKVLFTLLATVYETYQAFNKMGYRKTQESLGFKDPGLNQRIKETYQYYSDVFLSCALSNSYFQILLMENRMPEYGPKLRKF